MSQRKKALVSGVAVLGIAGVIGKVIGMLFRVPLGNTIGSGGMGIYGAVYSAYTMLLAISTAGIPVAISRLVSESVTTGRPREARAILRTAFWLLLGLGLFLSVLLVAFARPLAVRTGDPETAMGYVAIAPSILLVSVMSAFRGYMQGRSRMKPTAVSQVIEQLGKVVIALPLAMWGMRTHGSVHAAALALLGISIGEGVAMVYMVIAYARGRKEFAREEADDPADPPPSSVLAKRIVRIAIPIVIGSMIVPLAGFIDSAMIRVRLLDAGFSIEQARSLYGLLTSFALALVNVPTALATAVCISLVPTISAARAEGRLGDMRETSVTGLRLASLISFPCTVGMSMLATPILALLYRNIPRAEIEIAGSILAISAWTIVFFTHVQATTGILQGSGLHKVPVYSLVLGVLVKIALNYTLVAVPSINIYGAPVASLACYIVSLAINLIVIVRKTGMRFAFSDIVLRPGIATAGMAAVVYLAMRVLDMDRRVNTLIAVFLGVLAYAVLVFAVGALRRDDMEQMPGGRKLERLLLRLRVWR